MNNNFESHLRDLERKIDNNEKCILVLQTQVNEVQKNMSEIKSSIKQEFKEVNQKINDTIFSASWKIMGAMGIIIMFLAGIVFKL